MPDSVQIATSPSAAEEWAGLLAGLPRQVRADLTKQIDLSAPPSFFEFAVQALTGDAEAGQAGAASRILLDHNLLVLAAANPSVLTAPQASELVDLAVVLDPQIGARLVRHLSASNRPWPEGVSEDEALRVLMLLEKLPGLDQLVISLLRFTQHPSKKVRSKGAKLLGRIAPSPGLFQRVYADADARVRANLVEGIAARPLPLTAEFVRFLQQAVSSEHPRVVAMALLALARTGDLKCAAELQALKEHPNEAQRKSAEFALRLYAAATVEEPASEIVAPAG
jgi:hypothetical protein